VATARAAPDQQARHLAIAGPDGGCQRAVEAARMARQQQCRRRLVAPAAGFLFRQHPVGRAGIVNSPAPVGLRPPGHRGHQRADATAVGGVGVGAGVEQGLHGGRPAVLRGEIERRLAVAGSRLDRRACGDQQRNHRRQGPPRRRMQRRLPEPGAGRGGGGAEGEQALRHRAIAAGRGPMKRRAVERVGAGRIGAGVEQDKGRLAMAALQRLDQRHIGIGLAGRGIDGGAGLDQQPDDLRLAVAGGPVERPVAVSVAQVDVGAECHEQCQHPGIAGPGREVDRQPRRHFGGERVGVGASLQFGADGREIVAADRLDKLVGTGRCRQDGCENARQADDQTHRRTPFRFRCQACRAETGFRLRAACVVRSP